MEIDPRLREVSHRPTDYGAGPPSSYTLNPIRLPPPQQQALPSLSQDGGHPYYAFRQGQREDSQSAHPDLAVPLTHQDAVSSGTLQAGDGGVGDLKRPRACEACRGLKVRCEPHPAKGTCRRCAKAGRQCVVTVPSRKRQKKTDSRVAELERKIDALTASLHATNGQALSGSDGDSFVEEDEKGGPSAGNNSSLSDEPHRWFQQPEPPHAATAPQYSGYSARTTSMSGRKRRRSSYHDDQVAAAQASPPYEPRNAQGVSHIDPPARASNLSSRPLSAAPADSSLPGHEYADVVDRRILDAATAADIFYNYTNNMAVHMPFVVFPPNVAAGEVRRTKPTLFLAILSVAAGRDRPDLYRLLQREITKVYADSIICKGEKSVELVQALQVSTIWYWPENYRDTRSYQLIHMAVTMAMAMGLGRWMGANKGGSLGLCQDKIPSLDADSIECRRAWLGCYFLTAGAALSLRFPHILRWSLYMDECIEILEGSDEATPSDKILCQWVKLPRMADDLRARFDNRPKDSTSCLTDPEVQSDLRVFEHRLAEWEKELPKNISSGTLTLGFHVVKLFAHQVAMCFEYNVGDLNMSRGPEKDGKQTSNIHANSSKPSQVEALTACLSSTRQILDTFLSFSVTDVRTMPICCFIQVAYATVFLLKLNFTGVDPKSDLKTIATAVDTHKEQYLQRLLDSLKAAAADDKSRPAQKFLMVLVMLKGWLERHREVRTVASRGIQDIKLEAQPVDIERSAPGYRKISIDGFRGQSHGTRPSPAQSPRKQTHQQIQQPLAPQMGNTPLHLLSEVATGDQAGSSSHHHHHHRHHHQQPQQIATSTEAWYNYADNNNNNNNMAGGGNAPVPYSDNAYYPPPPPPSRPDAGLGPVPEGLGTTPYHHAMDPGLEQALGMTFGGEGDLRPLFMDDSFLDSCMQGNPGLLAQYWIGWEGQ